MNAFGAEDREKEEKRFRGVEEVEKKKKQKRETRGPLKNTKSKKKKPISSRHDLPAADPLLLVVPDSSSLEIALHASAFPPLSAQGC